MEQSVFGYFRFALGLLVLACAMHLSPAIAATPVYAENGAAISGYDPVAYFTDDDAIKGSPKFSYEWQGATWHFASASHRDLFAKHPGKYAPQFGGHCAYAAAKGHVAPSSPRSWTIQDDKLYLNYNAPTKAVWEQDQEKFIQAGHEKWSTISDQ